MRKTAAAEHVISKEGRKTKTTSNRGAHKVMDKQVEVNLNIYNKIAS